MTDAMLDASTVGVAKGRPGGYAAVFPLGTPLTTLKDVSKTLEELVAEVPGADSLGYISEDGVTIPTDTSAEDRRDWGGNVIKSELTEFATSISVTFLESRDSVLMTVYGDANVSTKDGVRETRVNQNFTGAHAFLFEHVIGDSMVRRTVVENGSITERDDLAMNNSDLLGYAPTIKCVSAEGRDPMVFLDFEVGSSEVPVQSVALDKGTLTLAVGAKETLHATVVPALATDRDVSWKSSAPAKATVSASGEVAAVAAGSATITAEAGGKSATCNVNVTA